MKYRKAHWSARASKLIALSASRSWQSLPVAGPNQAVIASPRRNQSGSSGFQRPPSSADQRRGISLSGSYNRPQITARLADWVPFPKAERG